MSAELKQSRDRLVLQEIIELMSHNQNSQAYTLFQEHSFEQTSMIQRQIEAELLSSMGEKDRAERVYLSIIREFPEAIEPQFSLASLYQQSGRIQQSIEILTRLIEKDNNFYLAWNNLGNLHRDSKNYAQALECYEKAISIKHDYAPSLCNLSLTLIDLNRTQECISRCEDLINNFSQHPLIYHHLALAYLKQEQKDKAIESLRKGLELDPYFQPLVLLNAKLTN